MFNMNHIGIVKKEGENKFLFEIKCSAKIINAKKFGHSFFLFLFSFRHTNYSDWEDLSLSFVFFQFPIKEILEGGGKAKMADPKGDSDSKPVIFVLNDIEEDGLSFFKRPKVDLEFRDSFSDEIEGILLFPDNVLSTDPRTMERTLKHFEDKISRSGGLEGKFVYFWVDPGDAKLEEDLIERLKLKERGCVWKFGAGAQIEEFPKIEQFFKENCRQALFKPAKRD